MGEKRGKIIPMKKSKKVIRLEDRGRERKLVKGAWFFGILAALCLAYCAGIGLFLGYGTYFFLIWGVMGAGFGIIALLCAKPAIRRRIPAVLIKSFWVCFGIGVAIFVLVEGLILSRCSAKGTEGADYVIVLGAQWKNSGPSKVLKYRLDEAAYYLRRNPGAKVIVSGGKGPGEPISEAEGMAGYLEHAGVDREKILVENGKVTGVRTRRGDEIHCDYVISGPYPNKVYTQMIEPLSEVPVGAIKMINGRKLSVVPVSVIMVIEGTPEENGVFNYSTFSGTTMDTNEIWENYSNITEPYNYITTICLNYANPTLPEGYTQLSITALVPSKPFEDVKEEEYYDLKRRLANEMIEEYIKIGGVDFRPRITEFEVTTPMTVSHYVGAWKGNIYGYSHSMADHAVARLQMKEKDHFIEGLEFAGAHGMSGDGMGPQITNGRAAAKAVREDMEKKKEAQK